MPVNFNYDVEKDSLYQRGKIAGLKLATEQEKQKAELEKAKTIRFFFKSGTSIEVLASGFNMKESEIRQIISEDE